MVPSFLKLLGNMNPKTLKNNPQDHQYVVAVSCFFEFHLRVGELLFNFYFYFFCLAWKLLG
jgi:hypothetical protein